MSLADHTPEAGPDADAPAGAAPAAPRALPAELTIYTVADCHALYLAWAGAPAAADADDDALRVDAAAVEDVDAAGVQLLLALAKGLARRHRTLRLADPSAALRDACTALGALHLLCDATALETAA